MRRPMPIHNVRWEKTLEDPVLLLVVAVENCYFVFFRVHRQS